MEARHEEVIERLREAVLAGPGELDEAARRGISAGDAPPGLAAYLGKVDRHAYRVTDAEVEELRAAGWSDDALFEATVSAAVGAGLTRLEAGLATIRAAAQ